MPLHDFYSGSGQAFTIAWIAFLSCLFTTVLISLCTKPKPEDQLKGLVYSLTERETVTYTKWYQNPIWLGMLIIIITLALNLIFY